MYTVVRAVRQNNGRCRDVETRDKKDCMDCLPKNGRCRGMAVIGGSTVSAKAKVIKSYNEDALEKTIYQSVTQKEKSEDSR